MNPPREDGRRCMGVDEMEEAKMEIDNKGRWRIEMTDEVRAQLASLR